jgi:hypothetical protein
MNMIEPGEFIVDAPTIENLGFRWYVKGDSNRNASVAVAYRKKGTVLWKPAQPLFRVHHEVVDRARIGYRTGNLFAGSVLSLQPNTNYDVRFTMSDPDGGSAEAKTVTVATRGEQQATNNGRKLHVFPEDFAGKRPAGSYLGLKNAYAAATAGDQLLLHAGVYLGPFTFSKAARRGKPIVIKSVSGKQAILQGADFKEDLVSLAGASYLILENLVFRNAATAINTDSMTTPPGVRPGAKWITIRGCRIENVIYGISTSSENSQNWTIVDNTIAGTNEKWHPRPQTGYMDGSHTGVRMYGQGHVVAYNQISRFSDALTITGYNPPPVDYHKHAVNIDYHNNDLSFATDDGLETDYSAHNIRVYRNRIYNAFTGMSAQPTYGGPIYFLRNELYGITELAYKWNNYPAGTIAYHNTTITTARGLRAPAIWQNGHYRNNLILGASHIAVETGTTTTYSSLDYNGYYGVPQEGVLFRWNDGTGFKSYPDLARFAEATGHEKHGIMVDLSIFQNAPTPLPGVTQKPGQYDLRLRAGTRAEDAGVRLHNINDEFTGSGADLGAYERGRPVVHYGPRNLKRLATTVK